MRAGAAAVLLAFALAAGSTGCGVLGDVGPNSCERSVEANPITPYTEGTVENGVYMSAPLAPTAEEQGLEAELLFYPGGMRYAIHHKLGALPRWWQVYLSFDSDGSDTGTLALAAGNQAEVTHVDDEVIHVVNGSCVEYWMLLVAGTGEEPPPAGPGEPGPR